MAVLRQGARVQDHYTMIANDILRRPDVSMNAMGIYCFMRSHREGWEISTKNIARERGLSESTVKRAVRELESIGYLERLQGRADNGKFGEVEYVVMAEPSVPYEDTVGHIRPPVSSSENVENPQVATGGHIWPPVTTSENELKPQVTTGGQNTASGEMAYNKKTIFFKEEQKEEKHMPAPHNGEGASDLHARFEAWYRAYPRKVGKQKAFLSWKKALKLVDEAELMEKTQAFAEHHRRVGTEKAFIPHPTTWLNRGGWDDELDSRPVREQNPTPSFMAVLDEMNRTAIPDDFVDGFVVGELE